MSELIEIGSIIRVQNTNSAFHNDVGFVKEIYSKLGIYTTHDYSIDFPQHDVFNVPFEARELVSLEGDY